ncbi:hybrid sensor histidine kinase/response regulator [Sphingomonas alba]|uniref:histidine kinase n=1 Tax=Sphingomonas alba TaxID=2908208 RepID=A0ABT0RLM8_9SPHN|nr:PAS domain-containing sensor histidine kinase [Sphingomonas alba]MCL6683377.1 PAS domain S-box protein [Sphingomonas alba]
MSDLLALSEEQRFRLLINSVTDYAIYMLDTEGRVATWNPGAERFKGYKAGEIIGKHYSRFFTPEDASADLPGKALRIAAREGRYEAEGWRIRKDGTRFWANAVLDPIRGDDGKLIGFAKITRDITDKREHDRALYESEQAFRMLVQGVTDYAIYMLDNGGRVTNWNPGAETIKGYSEDEIVGEHFSRFYTEEDRENGEPERALQIALKEGKYEREAWRVRKDGTLFWAHVLIDPIFNEQGEHIGFAKITRDITQRKRAQEELEQTREVLAQSQKLQALGELTGGIAHDFNNLMTVIAGASDFLLKNRDLPEEKKVRYLEAIVETTGRAKALTDHLLAFGRRQSLNPVVIDLAVRLDALAEMTGRMLGSLFKVNLEIHSKSPVVEVDSAHLETALLNAVVNARDAMPEGGELTLSTSDCQLEGRDAICISVRDNGPGIPPDVLKRVFEPFYTTKAIGKGTGLGLSQIHGFAAQAGGAAEIRSQEGVGTEVRIILLRTQKTVENDTPGENCAALPNGLKVLLVEDNLQVREFAAELLKDLRCEVHACESGDEALEKALAQDFDLVFSDIVMPGLSGLQLAQAIEKARPNLPILLATGYSDELVGKHSNHWAVVAKPYDGTTLAAAIAAAIQDKRAG